MINDIQEPLLQEHENEHRELSTSSMFKIVLGASILPPLMFGIAGGFACYLLDSLDVEIGNSDCLDTGAPATLGGALWGSFIYTLYLLYQKGGCFSACERAAGINYFFERADHINSKTTASFVLLLGYSLLAGYAVIAGTTGHVVLENIPYSKYDTDLSQVILTIVLGSGIYTPGIILLILMNPAIDCLRLARIEDAPAHGLGEEIGDAPARGPSLV